MGKKGKSIFIILLLNCLLCTCLYSEELPSSKDEIRTSMYAGLTGGCSIERNPLVEEHCYQAQMVKAYVDVLVEEGYGKREIYLKVARKFSRNLILREEIRERVRSIMLQEARSPQPLLALESLNYHFGETSRIHERISGRILLYNKGKGILKIKKIRSSEDWLSISLGLQTKNPVVSPNEIAQIYPGEKAELRLMVDLIHPTLRNGYVGGYFVVESNDPNNPILKVLFDASIRDPTIEEIQEKRKQQYEEKKKQLKNSRNRYRRGY